MKNINGNLCKLMEQRDDLFNWIKELETTRSKEDLTNTNKYQDLYSVYHNIVNEINKIEMEEI